jgi:hypothetical protein
MRHKLATLAIGLAMSFVATGYALAETPTKNGGGSSAPPGYGANWGGYTNSCGNCGGGGHNKNGGGHAKNGGGNGGGGNGGGGGGGVNGNDHILCYVGNRAVYVSSARHCRRLIAQFNYNISYSYGNGGGYDNGDGYVVRRASRATRMQMSKRAKRYAAHGGRKAYRGKRVGKHARRGHGGGHGGGKTINVYNYGGNVQINKNGGF